MKRILLLLSLAFFSFNVIGQACGIHVIKYVGEIQTEDKQITKIILPSLSNLIGEENKEELMFVEGDLTKNGFECMSADMTCNVLKSAKMFNEVFSRKIKYVSIVIELNYENNLEKVNVQVPWEEVEMKDGKEGKRKFFVVDLGEIKIE